MNPIQSIEKSLKERFPDATFIMDAPLEERPHSIWFLDIVTKDCPLQIGETKKHYPIITIEWNETLGFAIMHKPVPFGYGPHKKYKNEEDVIENSISLISEGY